MITATLAAWVPPLTFEALPVQAHSRAKLAIFDACGTALAQLHDGRSLTATVEHERGSPQRPPTRQEFEAKFRQCARDVLTSDQALLAARYLYQLDTLPDLRRVLDALSLAPNTA